MAITQDLQEKFGLNDRQIEVFIQTAPNRYKFHTIKKRHGGTREIAQPTKSLKIIQRWIIKEYFSKCTIHKSASAYIKNKNIVDFVNPHKNNNYLLKVDFKNFFNSIKITDFYTYCKFNCQYFNDEDVKILGLLLFCRNKKNDDYYLSIGAPSSPMISNILMTKFDELVYDLCKDNRVIYTRYADDLAFSTNSTNTLVKILQRLSDICTIIPYPENLEINTDKTVFTSKKNNRTLTGLVISNDGTISIGREQKRTLRAMAHKAKLGLLSAEELATLKGKVAFIKCIDFQFAQKLETSITQ